MTTHEKITKMAMELLYGTPEQKKVTAEILVGTDIDEIVNILEVSREVIFENSGDQKLAFATSCMIDFIYQILAMRTMKGSYIRNAH
jgi:hypothetical protein